MKLNDVAMNDFNEKGVENMGNNELIEEEKSFEENKKKKKHQFGIRLDEELVKNLDRVAEENGVTRAKVITSILEGTYKLYLKTFKYISEEQGEEIRISINNLVEAFNEYNRQNRYFNNNLNQFLRVCNNREKYGLYYLSENDRAHSAAFFESFDETTDDLLKSSAELAKVYKDTVEIIARCF